MREYYKAHEDKIWSIIKIMVIIASICVIFISAVQAIRKILDTGEQYYRVEERSKENITINAASYQKEFTAVAGTLTYLDIAAAFEERTSGTVQWQIKGSDGESITELQENQIEELQNSNRNGLHLDVAKAGLVQGKNYILSISFARCKGFSIIISDRGLDITQYYTFMHKALFVMVIVLCSILGIIIIVGSVRSKMGLRWYVILALYVGLMAAFFQPPASQDDEYRHFIRAYTLANGQWEIELTPVTWEEYGVLTAGANGCDYIATVPKEIREICLLDYGENYNNISYYAEANHQLCVDKLLSVLGSPEEKGEVSVSVVVTSQKGMASYWPQTLAIWVAQHLGIRSILLPYAARIGQLLACVWFGWLAIRLAPKYKNIIWLISLMPNVIVLKSSNNCDGLLIAETVLLMAVILWMREHKIDIVSRKAILADIGIIVLLWQIVSIKLPDILFGLGMLLLMGWDNIRREVVFLKRYWKIALILIAAAIGGILFWVFGANGKEMLISALYQFVPQWHVEYILDYPKDIVILFIYETLSQCKGLLQAMNGQSRLPLWVVVVVGLAFCKRELPLLKRFLMAVLLGGMILIMVLVGFTMMPPDTGYIWGVTYRYLFPFLPAFGLMLPSGTKWSEEKVEMIYPALLVMVEVTTGISWIIWLNRL